MKTKAFNWGRSTMVSDRAYWMGFYLEAWEDGRWRVTFADERGHPLVDHTKQAIGTNISEAKQRAQAAAMIQQQLAQMTKP
jgi:hypothetical protein